MTCNNPTYRFLIGLHRPFAAFVGAAEQDTVSAGKHIVPPVDQQIVYLPLRQQDRQLTFDGRQFLIIE